MTLPFSPAEFFEVLAAYNRALWPAAVALWLYAAVCALLLARRAQARAMAAMLAVQWAWAGVAYHAVFFTRINPAAWIFSALSVLEAGVLAWFGVYRRDLRFAPAGSPTHVAGWVFIAYGLIYPALAQIEGHAYPAAPTFGVPCPTTLLTAGLLLMLDQPWPKAIAVVPLVWAIIGGSAAVLLGVRVDFMLWAAAAVLSAVAFFPRQAKTKGSKDQKRQQRPAEI